MKSTISIGAILATLVTLTGCTSSLQQYLAPSSTDILIAAHRGGYENDKADHAPENSVANIRVSKTNGYHLYETDIQRTKDGHFVIMHDPTIERETNGTGKVSNMTLAELKELHKKFRDDSVSCERIATLEEFLQQGKGITIFKADLKPGVSKYFKEIMQVVVKQDALDSIIFRVPYHEANLFERYKADSVPYAKSLLMFKVSTKEQIDDIKVRFDPLAIQINVSKSDPTNRKTLALIQYAVNQGLLVQTHAEGKAEDWRKLINAGVRMFHTNNPSTLKTFLLTVSNTI